MRHGSAALPRADVATTYHQHRLRLGDARYAWIDSLFALPEAVLYVNLVEFFDHHAHAGTKPSYGQLWKDIRECIDLAHRDGSIKTLVAADMPTYIERDPGLAEALHRFRSSGKRLFLLTNSEWSYTDPVMGYLLDDTLPAYPSWRNFFDVVIVSGTKPAFFTEDRPFVELDAAGNRCPSMHDGAFVRGRVYAGGNLKRVRGARPLSGGGDAVHRRPHLWRHVALAEVVGLADGDGAAGAGARG